MWEWGNLFALLLVIKIDDNNSWGAGHFSVWFSVLFSFFWRNSCSLSLLFFFVVLAMVFWEDCV